MYSVTRRIASVKQPYGGYIKRTDFKETQLKDIYKLHPKENIVPSLVGTAVDYMTRFIMGTPVEMAFNISIKGADYADEEDNANELIKRITGLNKESITAACKLSGYDVCYRAGMGAYRPVSMINPDDDTIDNIMIMINRSISFWDIYGPIVLDGFTFEGGYTRLVSSGDGDYLTKDTLWDFKILKNDPSSKYTLQLLMYYILGKHSIHKEFDSIKYLGFYNPRLNVVYRYPVTAIPKHTIETVSHDVLGYGWTDEDFNAYKKTLGLKPLPLLKKKEKKEETSKLILNQQEASPPKKNVTFKKGDQIFHKKFGKGIILSIESNEKREVAVVKFDSDQERRIITSYLEPVY